MIQKVTSALLLLLLLAGLQSLSAAQADGARKKRGSEKRESLLELPEIQTRLELAGDNRAELEDAISKIGKKQTNGLKFLILNMPESDLKQLSSEFLLSNIKLAYRARAKAPWKIPDEIFFNDVLPYANVDEPRDPWRKEFYDICRPIVKGCKTPGEAAQKLNETIFTQLSVKYSTKRKRANQSPKESIEQGLASCTGLSIILTDACRSVGVPARLTGIPSWKNKRGNHTWVEVWDDGWHFTGAAEPSSEGLDNTWFQGDAALADPDSKQHSIYAVSFQKTETVFPMVWSKEKRVYAENVTKRYIDIKKLTADSVSVMIRAWNKGKKERQIVDVEVVADDESEKFSGKTKAGTADMNDMLTFELKPNSKYHLGISLQDKNGDSKKHVLAELQTGDDSSQLVEFEVSLNPSTKLDDGEHSVEQDKDETHGGTTEKPDADKAMLKSLGSKADQYFMEASNTPERLMLKMPDRVRELAWERYLKSPIPAALKKNFDNNQVTFEKHLSPYTIKEVGKRPEGGWPLFIAMHGGGGAPARVNDSQWRHMQIYYKDQEQLTGYKYLALRAPNNTWNGFYDDYVYPLIENLVRQHIAHGDVDPNKVFIMGYSHGGYGAFAIGPKIPFRFAAVHSSAAAPTDGQTSAKTLRNTRFTFMVGENDTAYGRRERCEKFAKQIKDLKEANEGDYPVEFMYKEGFGHGGLPDRDMISQMYEYERNPAPKHVTWEMTDTVVKRFFWLKNDSPERGSLIDAKIEGNQISVKTDKCNSFSILLDSRLIDPAKPIELKIGDSINKIDYKPSFKTLCETMATSGDPNLAFDFEIKVNLQE